MCNRCRKAQAVSENQRGEIVLTDQAHQLTTGGGKPGQGYPAVLVSEACSQGSEEWTTGSHEPDGSTLSSANPTSGDEACSPNTGPECPSTTTYEPLAWMPYRTLQQDGTVSSGFAQRDVIDALHQPTGNKEPLISYVAVSPAKTSPLPASAEGSPGNDPDCSLSSPEPSTLFDPDGHSSRTYPDCSPRTAVGTSESCLERWPTSGTAWHGGLSTAVSSECRSDDAGCSSSEPSLAMILEEPRNVAARYSLSARAAQGILRRAEKRGRTLPSHLSVALEQVAQTTPTDKQDAS